MLTDYRAIVLTDYRTKVMVRVKGPLVSVGPIVRCIIKCDPEQTTNSNPNLTVVPCPIVGYPIV